MSVTLLRLASLSLVVVIATSCSSAPQEKPGEEQAGTTQDETSEVAIRGGPADAIVLSSFVGSGRNLAIHIRWEEFGSAQIRGELRVADAMRCGDADSGSSGTDTYRSRFAGTRDRSTLVLEVPAKAPGDLGGTWVGKLLGNGAGGASPSEGPALRLEAPKGNRMLLSEGAERDYADAVARLAEDCGEDPPGRS